MRIATVSALAGICLVQAVTASAADLDYGTLRGSDYDPAPVPIVDWSGFYIGGHGGWSSTAHGFSSSLQPLVAQEFYRTIQESEFAVSGLLRAGPRRTTGGSFGGFAGYNFVADDFVFGIEADYTYLNQAATSSDTISRAFTTSNGILNVVNLAGSSQTNLVDYGTLRGRVGYAFGSVLPFVTAGVAFGHAKTADQASIQAYGYNVDALNSNLSGTPMDVPHYGYTSFNRSTGAGTPAAPVYRSSSAQKYVAGFSAGFGLEVALTSNIFLRGEYQYIEFDDFGSHKANVNTVRGAAAIKF